LPRDLQWREIEVRLPRQSRRRPAHQLNLGRWGTFLPALVAAILSLPCLSLGYFWDDYYFLTFRASGDARAYLLPDPHAAFYRPISQGLYFLLLRLLDPVSGTVGHILNLGILACAVSLLALLVTRLSGARAGVFSGLALAAFGLVPGLVAWISCSQDLLAVAFVLAAFLLRHERKDIGALACATAAILCKEPAIAAFPVLVLWDRLVGRPAVRPWFQIPAYVCVAAGWALVHPGIRELASRGFRSGATGYVGWEHPWQWGHYLVRYILTLANLPPRWVTLARWDDRVGVGLIAIAAILGGFLFLGRRRPESASKPLPVSRLALIAALFGIPTLLMPTVLIRHWAPYFAFFPATSLAIVLGPLLARQRTIVSVAALTLFLLLGVRYRGIQSEVEPIWTERVFVDAANAVRTVRGNFRSVLPTIPKGSQVVVSVSSTGVRGIYSTLVEGQALRVWYRDPTLQTVTTLQRRPVATPELLVRITTDLDVISIDPDSIRLRASNRYTPDLTDIGRPIVNYARAVAAGGDTERAVRIVQGLAQAESGANRAFVQRVSAMMLLAAGRREEAAKVLAGLPALSREDALQSLKPLLTEASSSEQLDLAAFDAFGLSADDPEAVRWIMQRFEVEKAGAQAAWYAQRLRRLVPGDPGAAAVIRAAERAGTQPRRQAL
jgi:hypothetical protein